MIRINKYSRNKVTVVNSKLFQRSSNTKYDVITVVFYIHNHFNSDHDTCQYTF